MSQNQQEAPALPGFQSIQTQFLSLLGLGQRAAFVRIVSNEKFKSVKNKRGGKKICSPNISVTLVVNGTAKKHSLTRFAEVDEASCVPALSHAVHVGGPDHE